VEVNTIWYKHLEKWGQDLDIDVDIDIDPVTHLNFAPGGISNPADVYVTGILAERRCVTIADGIGRSGPCKRAAIIIVDSDVAGPDA
jgi:hypothetical protein